MQQPVQQPLQQRWRTGEATSQCCMDQNDNPPKSAINAEEDREKAVEQSHAVFHCAERIGFFPVAGNAWGGSDIKEPICLCSLKAGKLNNDYPCGYCH